MGTAEGGVGLMFLQDLWRWLTSPAHWHGVEGIPNRMYEHIQLSAFAVGAAALIAIPLGIFFGHRRRGAFLAASVINIGRAMPSFAIIALALPVTISLGLGLGFWPSWLALLVLAMPPMFTNALTAIQQVDRDIIEAARGMGMRRRRILLGVEIPLAAPLIVAGVRTATVQVVATAPLAALVAWGGLGRFIIDGLATRDYPQVAGGAILVALLSIVTELALGFIERGLSPGGSHKRRRAGYGPGPAVAVEEAARPTAAA